MGRNKHCTEDERKIVQTMRNHGKSLREIGKNLGRSLHFVQNALSKKQTRETRGRPHKTSSETDRRIVVMAKKDPFMSSRAISAAIGNEVSAQTVRRRLLQAKLPGRIARKVPLMRKQNIKMRLQFAREHLPWSGCEGEKKWRNILWSDETKINLFGNDCQRNVRRPKGKEFHVKYTKKTVKHGGGNIMVWGCFSWNGVGPIYRIESTMNADGYRGILENVMLPYASENMPLSFTFQQDNDPKHKSRLVTNWFSQNNVRVLSWPSQSPDLNPIENLWSELKKRLSKEVFKNKDDLWEKTQKIWYDIPLETCQKLISSMPRRMQKLVQNRGGCTGY